MEHDLDILLLDRDWYRVKVLYRKFPAKRIRKALSEEDFVSSLELQPKAVILDRTLYISKEKLIKALSERLTSESFVVIWDTDKDYRKEMAEALRAHGVNAISFDFHNQYLWISLYNIIN